MKDIYYPLALKERPRYLDDLIGQDNAIKQVKGILINKRIPRSILVYGPYGSGKTTIARMLAQYFNCTKLDLKTFRYCGECHSCKLFGVDGSTDRHTSVTESNGSDQRKIDDVRQLLTASKFLSQHKYRVFILDEIHQWTKDSMQAFLKSYEEPPPSTIFILITNHPEKLPDTIKSRATGRIKIEALTDVDCAKAVRRTAKKYEIEVTKEQCLKIAQSAQSHPRDAMQILEGIWNFISGGGEFSDKLLSDIISDMEMFNPYQISEQLLVNMYKGNYPNTLTILQGVEETSLAFLFKHLLSTHIEVIYNFFDQTKGTKLALKTKDHWKYKKAVQQVGALVKWYGKDSMNNLISTTELLTKATRDLNHFGEFDPKGIAITAMLKCTDLFFITKQKNKSDKDTE